MTHYQAAARREDARERSGRFGFWNQSESPDVRLAAEQPERTRGEVLRDAGYVEPSFRPYYSSYARTRRTIDKTLLATMPPPSQMKAVDTESGTLHIPYPAAIKEFTGRTGNPHVAVPVALTKDDGTVVKKFVSITVPAIGGYIERNALDAAPEGDEVDLYRELDRLVDHDLPGDHALRWEEAPGLGKDPRHWARLLAGRARDRQAVAAAVISSTQPRPVPAERIAKFLTEFVEDIKPDKRRR